MEIINDLVARVRILINDQNKLEYSDPELIGYINDAIGYLSTYLISAKDPEMVSEINVAEGGIVPTNFCSFSGSYPVYIVDNTFKLYDPTTPFTARYFASKQTTNTRNSTFPFKDIYIPVVIRLASIYALNRNEFNITQDNTIIVDMLNMIKAAKA